MNLPSLPACALLAAAAAAFAQNQSSFRPRTETWIMPSPESQIYIEGLDDRKGLGRIFLPAMTNPANEPLCAVFGGGELVGEQQMGSSFFLPPGRYTVVLGTGSFEQRIQREVEVRREETVIIQPDWCTLTVEVIDEFRNYVKQDLQIFRVENAESYGIVPAIDPELGEQLQSLVLRPGLYKVVKRGEDFNTYVNFATLLLEPGSYTPMTVVVDTVSAKFVGAGILTSVTQLRQRKNWRLYGAVHGSVLFTSANNATRKEVSNNLSFLGQLDHQIALDKFPHYYLSRNLLEMGGLQQQGAQFAISQDRLQFKNTYVYYLLKWLGGYSRFEVATHLFPTEAQFDPPQDIIQRDLKGQDRSRPGLARLTTQPAFYPLQLKEGLGVNVTPLRRFLARLSLRTGLGYWQIYNRDVYAQDGDTTNIYKRIADSFPQGMEVSLVSNFALLRNLTITTEADVLFPCESGKGAVSDLENFVSLRLSKIVTLEHTLRLSREQDPDYTIQEQLISVKFSYFLF
jgi:hypothetical protein